MQRNGCPGAPQCDQGYRSQKAWYAKALVARALDQSFQAFQGGWNINGTKNRTPAGRAPQISAGEKRPKTPETLETLAGGKMSAVPQHFLWGSFPHRGALWVALSGPREKRAKTR
jgi:hypothetical protein